MEKACGRSQAFWYRERQGWLSGARVEHFRVTVILGIPKSGCLVARSPSTGSLDFSWYHSDKNTDSNAIRPSGAAPRPSVARVAGPRNEGVRK